MRPVNLISRFVSLRYNLACFVFREKSLNEAGFVCYLWCSAASSHLASDVSLWSLWGSISFWNMSPGLNFVTSRLFYSLGWFINPTAGRKYSVGACGVILRWINNNSQRISILAFEGGNKYSGCVTAVTWSWRILTTSIWRFQRLHFYAFVQMDGSVGGWSSSSHKVSNGSTIPTGKKHP